jgi:hypothetical protein
VPGLKLPVFTHCDSASKTGGRCIDCPERYAPRATLSIVEIALDGREPETSIDKLVFRCKIIFIHEKYFSLL